MPVTHAYVPRGRSLTGQAQGGRLVGLLIDLQAVRTWTAPRPGLEPHQAGCGCEPGALAPWCPLCFCRRRLCPHRPQFPHLPLGQRARRGCFRPAVGNSGERGWAALPSRACRSGVGQGLQGALGARLGPLATERLASAAPGEGGPSPGRRPAWAPGACVPGRGTGGTEQTSGEIGLPVYPQPLASDTGWLCQPRLGPAPRQV